MLLKDADGMANSVDSDQTAPRSSLIWVCTVCPGLSVRKLRIITVLENVAVLLNSNVRQYFSSSINYRLIIPA